MAAKKSTSRKSPSTPSEAAVTKPRAKAAKSARAATPAASPQAAISGKEAAGVVDQQLARYRSMRDFSITSEPSGEDERGSRRSTKLSRGLPFVIQKHAASHLHYDFRLGWNGVLKSWAVAKGPSFYPGDKRLAVQVEDHPVEYGGFEGIIPAGQYGGGIVMVWDQGTWWPQPGHENVDAGLRDGALKFELDGHKLKGKWTLVRMKPHTSSTGKTWGSSDKPNWLLIKEHDEYERGEGDKPITETMPDSALTRRSLEEIAAASDHVWNSKGSSNPGLAAPATKPSRSRKAAPVSQAAPRTTAALRKASPRKNSPRKASRPAPGKSPAPALDEALASLPREKQPAFLPPQLAVEVATPPEGAGWLHELKLDGYRIQARKDGGKVALLTRKGLDWTDRMPSIAAAVAALPVESCTLDGEVVVLAEDGTTSFADLQAAFQEGARHTLTYFVFDLLHLDGRNPRQLPLLERKRLLEQILPAHDADAHETEEHETEDHDAPLRYSEHLQTGGAAMFSHACSLHAEGIISKQDSAPYSGSRGGAWLKCKCRREQELVIGGYTWSAEGRDRIGALLLGYYDNGELIYAGRTGTGFTQAMRRDLLTRLEAIGRRSPAFDRIPGEARRDALWVEPKLVAEVRFATWTADGLVRQAAFLGLREDKAPHEVRREEPTVPAPQQNSAPHRAGHAVHRAGHRSATAVAARVAPASVPEPAAASPAKPRARRTRALPAAPATLRLTHPEKVLDAQSGLTKRKLADYYAAVAAQMLPHIAGRPVSLVRCPEGVGGQAFFQKHPSSMLPKGAGVVEVPNGKTGKPESYITIDHEDALIGLAQMDVLEIHPWGSTAADIEHPDRLIFDLDPDETLPWTALTTAAREIRARLKRAGLESFLKLTGGKGLHVVAPILPEFAWPQVKDAAHQFVLALEREDPARFLTKMTKSARAGKIFLDYLRNERGATAVAPYSPRARAGVAVSVPLPWSALDETTRPIFGAAVVTSWTSTLSANPWKRIQTVRQSLDPLKLRDTVRLASR